MTKCASTPGDGDRISNNFRSQVIVCCDTDELTNLCFSTFIRGVEIWSEILFFCKQQNKLFQLASFLKNEKARIISTRLQALRYYLPVIFMCS